MLEVFIQVMILFAMIGVGFICKRLKIISNNMNKDISGLLVNATVPALIIVSLSSLSFSPQLLKDTLQLLAISFCLFVFLVLVSYLSVKLLRVKGTSRDMFQFAIIFGNTSYMGYPVAYAIFGEKGLFFMAICDVINPLFMWTFGVKVMGRPHQALQGEEENFSLVQMIKQIINPSILAVGFSFILLGFALELPVVVKDFLHLLGGLTTPLAMIFLGSILGDLNLGVVLQDKKLIFYSIEKLVLLPLIVFFVLKMMNFSGYLLQIPVLYAAMPTAVLTSVLATRYGNDYQLASKLIFISTLFSILTIPALVLLIS